MQQQINTLIDRAAAMEARAKQIEQNQQDHLALSQSVRVLTQNTSDNTQEVMELLAAFKGAFVVLNFIGHAAKPVLWLTAMTAAFSVAWTELRSIWK